MKSFAQSKSKLSVYKLAAEKTETPAFCKVPIGISPKKIIITHEILDKTIHRYSKPAYVDLLDVPNLSGLVWCL